MGFYISFSGNLTFKNSHLPDVAKKLPINSLLVETDSPFLSPVPFRGKTNEPGRTRFVADYLAQLHNLTINEVEVAMRGENISLPAGTLEADNIDLTLNLDKSYNDIDSIKQLPIKKIMQVHDELVFEVSESDVVELQQHVEKLMCAAADLSVPLTVETGLGANWDEAH